MPHTVPVNSRGGRALRHTGIPRDCAGVASARRGRDAKEPNSWWARKVERYRGQRAGHKRSGGQGNRQEAHSDRVQRSRLSKTKPDRVTW